MILALFSFFKSPIGKYLLIAVASIGLFLGVRSHFIHQGQLEGKQEATDQLTVQREKERAEDRTQLNIVLKNASDLINAAKQQADEASKREQAQAVLINNIISQRNVAVAKVQSLSDAQLHQDVISKLAIRLPNDLTVGYTAAEEREIDVRVTGYPFYKDQSDKADERIKALQDKSDGIQKQVDQLNIKFNALAAYTVTVERDYTDLYNSFPRKGNPFLRVITFGLAGKPKKIPTPDPATLLNNRPK